MAVTFEPRLARIAAMIADPARSRMLAYLLDGHYAAAGELAAVATVAVSTASAHLAKLQHAGLISVEARGRHRYFRLADAEVAHALEALALVAERGSHERRWAAPARAPLRHARCCYGHLAGRVGVALLAGLQREDFIESNAQEDFVLTAKGSAWLAQIGLPAPVPCAPQRLAYGCMDWSERRDHLAGVLAAALLQHFFAHGWLAHEGEAAPLRSRALRLTPPGQQALGALLQL